MATELQRAVHRLHYVCAECGAEAPKWQGRCPACAAWNSLSEDVVRLPGRKPALSTAAGITTPMEAVMDAPARVQATRSLLCLSRRLSRIVCRALVQRAELGIIGRGLTFGIGEHTYALAWARSGPGPSGSLEQAR